MFQKYQGIIYQTQVNPRTIENQDSFENEYDKYFKKLTNVKI